jgi:putative FmdB family regulatory protein
MPYYAYRCEKCGEAFEIRATFAEKEAGLNPECPKCHVREARQVLTAGMMLRGGGGDGAASSGGCCGPSAGPGCC